MGYRVRADIDHQGWLYLVILYTEMTVLQNSISGEIQAKKRFNRLTAFKVTAPPRKKYTNSISSVIAPTALFLLCSNTSISGYKNFTTALLTFCTMTCPSLLTYSMSSDAIRRFFGSGMSPYVPLAVIVI